MKKVITVILTLALLFSLAACGGKQAQATPEPSIEATPVPSEDTSPEATPEETAEPENTEAPATETPVGEAGGNDEAAVGDLQGILDELLEVSKFDASNFYTSYEVTKTDAPFVLGYDDFAGDYEEALAYGPAMGSIAFVMVLFRLDAEQDAEAFAADIKSGANPVKWVCVQADAVETAISGQTVMFIMADNDSVKLFTDAFNEVMA